MPIPATVEAQSTSEARSPPPPLLVPTSRPAKPLSMSRSSMSGAGDTSRPRSPAVGVARARSRSARTSAGPGEADTPDASGKAKPKKPKKKGWKGWAMQDLDEFGNVIEERLRNETPPRELTAEEKALADAAFAAVVDAEEAEARARSAEASRRNSQNISREASASRTVHSDPVGSKAGNQKSVSPEGHQPSARLDTTSGLKPILIVPTRSQSPHPASSGTKASRPRADDGGKDKAPPKKRRKNSLSMTPQPSESRATSSAPRPAPAANGKGKARASLPSTLALTARQQGIEAKSAAAQLLKESREAKEAASLRATPYVVDDDAPLPQPPRKGMGDEQPAPPESDLRGEAAFILESAEKHRQERSRKEVEAARSSRSVQPVSPPLTGAEDDIPPLRVNLPNGTGDHSTSYQTPAPTSKGFPASTQAGPSRRQPHVSTDEEFAANFEAMKQRYTEQENHVMPVFSDEPKPAKFHPGQKPSVVLAAQQGRLPGRIRDKHERAYLEGFDGLPEEFEREIVGFITNVRSNMKTVVDFYFDHPTFRRDSFIERLGRELSILGAQLSSDGDAALLPERSPSVSQDF